MRIGYILSYSSVRSSRKSGRLAESKDSDLNLTACADFQFQFADESCNVPVPSDACALAANGMIDREVLTRGPAVAVAAFWSPLWYDERATVAHNNVNLIQRAMKNAAKICSRARLRAQNADSYLQCIHPAEPPSRWRICAAPPAARHRHYSSR